MPKKQQTLEPIDTRLGAIPTKKKIKELEAITNPPAEVPPVVKQRKKRILTEEQKVVLRERLVKARAVRAEKKKIESK